jgi:hypothetical protein
MIMLNGIIYYIHYYPRVTLKTYLPVKRIGNNFLVLAGDNNGYRPFFAQAES